MFLLKEDAYSAPVITQIPNKPFPFLWRFSARHRWYAIFATLFVVIAASLVTAMGLLYKYLVDAILAENYELVMFLVIGYPALIYVEMLFWRLSGFTGMTWATRMEYDVYNSLVAYANKHSHTYFIDRFAGSLLSKVDNVAESALKLVHDYLWVHLESGIMIITSFLLIFTVDVTVGLYSLLLLVTLFTYNWYMTPRQTKLSLRNAETYTTLRGQIVDTFSNIAAVRQHAMRGGEERRMAALAHDSRIAHKNSWFFSEVNVTVNMTIMFIFSVVIMYTLFLRWESGAISSGDLILVLALFTNVTGAMTHLGRAFNETAKAYGKMTEGLRELVAPYEILDAPRAKKLTVKQGQIFWDNVTFEYGQNRVFKNFELTITPGQRVGLVGSSGAGKTTFVSLLLRQHELTDGAIMIDGQDISQVTQDSLRQNIAVVPQEPMLFHRTIKENIAYGKPQATQKEIEAVAKKAQAHSFIKDLPEGYDTMVGERGVKLSGGQKQRVAIARAMLKDAPILVLDEATSALDSESEVAIQTALHRLMRGKTVIAIAHRLSTLREMDRIIVLDKGKIVEDGSHEALVAYGGVYANLWRHQAGGFLQE